ncbi:MAG: DUF4240 domain-containing protein, partial [Pseudomonadota bacterium]
IDAARAAFERVGASEGVLARLAAERAAVEAEVRARPAGKPDPRKMDAAVFWEVVGAGGEAGPAGQIDAMTDRLARFKATPIKAFDAALHALDARAYRSDLWALAYLLSGGCSDDAFAAFRCWLILQGEAVFEAALAHPDAFEVARFRGDFEGALGLWDVPLAAYEIRTGKGMARRRSPRLCLPGPALEEAAFADALPRVAAALRA